MKKIFLLLCLLVSLLALTSCGKNPNSKYAKAYEAVDNVITSSSQSVSRTSLNLNSLSTSDFEEVSLDQNLAKSIRVVILFAKNLCESKNYTFIDGVESCKFTYSNNTFEPLLKFYANESENLTSFFFHGNFGYKTDSYIEIKFNFSTNTLEEFYYLNCDTYETYPEITYNFYCYHYVNGKLYCLKQSSSLFVSTRNNLTDTGVEMANGTKLRVGKDYSQEYSAAMDAVNGKQQEQAPQVVDLTPYKNALSTYLNSLNTFEDVKAGARYFDPALDIEISVKNQTNMTDFTNGQKYINFINDVINDSSFVLYNNKSTCDRFTISNIEYAVDINLTSEEKERGTGYLYTLSIMDREGKYNIYFKFEIVLFDSSLFGFAFKFDYLDKDDILYTNESQFKSYGYYVEGMEGYICEVRYKFVDFQIKLLDEDGNNISDRVINYMNKQIGNCKGAHGGSCATSTWKSKFETRIGGVFTAK